MQSDIAQVIDALIRSGNTEGLPTYDVPGFQLIDIYQIFEHAFSDRAKATMANTTKNLLHQYNEKVPSSHVLVMLGKLGLKSCVMYKDQDPVEFYVRKADCVNFAASRATAEKLPLAINKVIAVVNEVADKGFTKASMVKLGVLKIMPIDSPEPEYIVISYITLTQKGMEYVKQNLPDAFIPEGGVPSRI